MNVEGGQFTQLRVAESRTLLVSNGLAAEAHATGGADTVPYRFRVYPERQDSYHPDHRRYLLSDVTGYDMWLYLRNREMEKANAASREPEPYTKKTVNRKML